MMSKPYTKPPRTGDPRRDAGNDAESQLAFYLGRAFANNSDLFVINGLRLLDPDQPEHDGSVGVCQIDHLVLHRWGAFIVESKSVHGEITVRSDGHDGDEWVRTTNKKREGIPSPIGQARRQADFLRNYLRKHESELLGRLPVGLRTIGKLVGGQDQRTFSCLPFQIIVAFSDTAIVNREGWTPPADPFMTFVTKADQVAAKIESEFKKHKEGGRLLKANTSQYGLWFMKQEEVAAVATFLAERDTPLRAPSPARAESTPRQAPPKPDATQPMPHTPDPAPSCKSCRSAELTAQCGPYGYYWKCKACAANTAMPHACAACGHDGRKDKSVRIRKAGPHYHRACERCGHTDPVWTEPTTSSTA